MLRQSVKRVNRPKIFFVNGAVLVGVRGSEKGYCAGSSSAA